MKKVLYPILQKLQRIMQVILYRFYLFFLKTKDNKIELQGN